MAVPNSQGSKHTFFNEILAVHHWIKSTIKLFSPQEAIKSFRYIFTITRCRSSSLRDTISTRRKKPICVFILIYEVTWAPRSVILEISVGMIEPGQESDYLELEVWNRSRLNGNKIRFRCLHSAVAEFAYEAMIVECRPVDVTRPRAKYSSAPLIEVSIWLSELRTLIYGRCNLPVALYRHFKRACVQGRYSSSRLW